MARLKPKGSGAVGALSSDQVWFLKFGDLGMPNGASEFPFGEGPEGWERARLAWFRHRAELLASKFPTSGPLFAETEFDDAYAEQREARRTQQEEQCRTMI